MRRRILLVDDEVAVLLTLKAVLEISGFDVDTAASGREGVSKLHTREYQMLITDMRMEHDVAGVEVIKAARAAAYHPAVALLTAFPVAEEDWQEMGADQLQGFLLSCALEPEALVAWALAHDEADRVMLAPTP